MRIELAAKFVGYAAGAYITYRLSRMLFEASMDAYVKEQKAKAVKAPGVEQFIDDLDIYAEHISKRIGILKMRLSRNLITLDQYNAELLLLAV
jgi:hypothetical protein